MDASDPRSPAKAGAVGQGSAQSVIRSCQGATTRRSTLCPARPTRPLTLTWSESSASRSLDRCCKRRVRSLEASLAVLRRRHGIAQGPDVAEVFGSSEASRSGTSRWGAIDPSGKLVERARKRWAQHDEQRGVPATDLPKERPGWRNSEATCRTFHLFLFHHTVQRKRQPS